MRDLLLGLTDLASQTDKNNCFNDLTQTPHQGMPYRVVPHTKEMPRLQAMQLLQASNLSVNFPRGRRLDGNPKHSYILIHRDSIREVGTNISSALGFAPAGRTLNIHIPVRSTNGICSSPKHCSKAMKGSIPCSERFQIVAVQVRNE